MINNLKNKIEESKVKQKEKISPEQSIQSKKFKESLRRGIPQIFYHTGCFLSEANEERAMNEIEMSDY